MLSIFLETYYDDEQNDRSEQDCTYHRALRLSCIMLMIGNLSCKI